MKYLVFSDLHGSMSGLERLKRAVLTETPDVLLCLGDILYGAYDGDAKKCADYLKNSGVSTVAVKGNCDYFFDSDLLGFPMPQELKLRCFNHRLLARHIPFYGNYEAGDIVMNGHTHMKTLYKDGGVIFCNPGSIGRPRDGSPSYAVIDAEGIRLIDADTSELIDFLRF